ncbi:MAG TPA: DnaJ domain-containing protein [Thermoanaerobaculia bacterium]
MAPSQPLPVAEAVRQAYLGRQDGMVEVDRSGGKERLYFRNGELFLLRDHPAARLLAPLLPTAGARPAAQPEIQRILTTLAHELVRDRRAAAELRDRKDPALELVGPLPTVLVAMETAVHGLNDGELLDRLGGESKRYQATNETPALRQLPGLEQDMAQVLVGLVQPASVGELLRGAGKERSALLRGLAKLRAVGLVAEVAGKAERGDDLEILSPKLLAHFHERLAESLGNDPVRLEPEAHRRRLAELLATLGKIDFYELLGVDLRAPPEEVLGAYHSLARIVHPTHAARLGFAGREDAIDVLFEQATEAYLVLSDPRRRASYNMIMGIQLTTEVDAATRDEEKKRLARQHYVRAGRCLSEMDYSLAVDLLKEAARLDPKAEYYARLGQAQTKNPHWHRHAVESYRRAVELAPADAGIRMGYGQALEFMERLSDARQQYREAMRLMPDHVGARDALDRIG